MRIKCKVSVTMIILSVSLMGCASEPVSLPTSSTDSVHSVSSAANNISNITSQETSNNSQAQQTTVSEYTNKQKTNKPFSVVFPEYKNYLNSLNKADIKSILSGIEKYKECVSDNKLNNDKLFNLFEEFYRECLFGGLDVSGEGKYWGYSDEELYKYGLVRWEDDGQQLVGDPAFMYNTFSKYLSTGKSEFLRISFEEDINNYFRETWMFVGTFDKYSDSLIVWENYAKKYKDYPEYKEEVASAKQSAKIRVMDLLNRNNDLVLGMFFSDFLSEEAQKSYLRFVDKYPNSAYQKIFKDYYNILKRNNFEYNNEAEKYLKANNLFIEKR